MTVADGPDQGSARTGRSARFGPDTAERVSAGAYGALIAATTLIGLNEAGTGSLVTVVILTNLIYYATHVFAYTIGDPTSSGWASIRHHLAVSAPMVSVTFAPVLIVVIAEILGTGRSDALVLGVITALIYLVGVATSGAYLKGLRPVVVIIVGALTFAVSVTLVLAKLSLH